MSATPFFAKRPRPNSASGLLKAQAAMYKKGLDMDISSNL